MKYFFLLIILNPITIYGINIRGIVYEQFSNEPIAYANVSIKGFSIGTISNGDGKFSLSIPENYLNEILVISFIGYKTQEFKLSELPEQIVVRLKPNQTYISEVVINPDSTIFTLLEKAYIKIKSNYSVTPTILYGFYNESASTPKGDFLYVAEAITKNYKTSYKNTQRGQVELLKSRKNVMPGSDSINQVRFYGGPFTVHSSDVVHERYEFIKPNGFKKYDYQYQGIIDYNGTRVYSIKFNSKNTNQNKIVKGIMYIEEGTLAYVYFDLHYFGSWSHSTPILKYRYASKKILYEKGANFWYLKSVIKEDSVFNNSTGCNFVRKNLFVTNKHIDYSIQPISYNNQIDYIDIFSNITDDYSDTYWKDYNILEQDSVAKEKIQRQLYNSKSNEFLKQEFKEKKNTRDKVISLLARLNLEYGLGLTDYNFSVDNTSLIFNTQDVINNNVKNSEPSLNIEFLFGIKVSKRVMLNYKGVESLNKNVKRNSHTLGIEYTWCLKKGGKQFFALPSIGYNFGYNGYKLGNISLNETTTVGGKDLESGDYNLYAGKKSQGLVTGIKFKTSISKMFSLVVGAEYSYYFINDNRILFEEDKKVLPKRAYQTFNNNVDYFENGQQVNKSSFELNNFSFNMGIRLNF